jgi:hypothetical protein
MQPYFAPRQLFPHGRADIARQHTHGHPLPPETGNKTELWNTRHVLLPFNLKDANTDIRNDVVRSLLYNIFPDTVNVTEGRYRSHIVFQVDKLPPGPWPLTVSGLPITISDFKLLGRALMFPRQILGNMTVSICQEGYGIDTFSDKVLRKLAAEVNDHFRKNIPDIQIIELMFTCERTIYIVLGDHINLNEMKSKLPGRIATWPTGYLHNKDLRRPVWADLPAKRQIEPQPTRAIVDNTVYDILRPGVMISSKMLKEHAHPAVLSTTSGVLVKNLAGDCFMTGASHGIGEMETIWQAGIIDKIIGKAVVELPFTDISLVELSKDVDFINETFENSGGVTPVFTRLTSSEDKHNWPICHLNSPYTGNMEGSLVMKSAKFEKSIHPTEDNLRYVVYNWSFMGQEENNESKTRPPDGTCGSAIWDDEGVILGFYHYYIAEGPWAGFSPSVSASEVVEAGYSL